MPASQEAISGLWNGWNSGEGGMKNQMDANWLRIGALMNLAVISRTLTAAPASPTDGDRYIVAAGATGVWAGMSARVAVYRQALLAWEFYVVKDGTEAVVTSEGTWGTKTVFKGGAWSPGVALG